MMVRETIITEQLLLSIGWEDVGSDGLFVIHYSLIRFYLRRNNDVWWSFWTGETGSLRYDVRTMEGLVETVYKDGRSQGREEAKREIRQVLGTR